MRTYRLHSSFLAVPLIAGFAIFATPSQSAAQVWVPPPPVSAHQRVRWGVQVPGVGVYVTHGNSDTDLPGSKVNAVADADAGCCFAGL